MEKYELTKYAEYLLKIAVGKCDNVNDAQDITQETLLAALNVLNAGKTIEQPEKWLAAVLNRKYYDLLRQKYRRPTVCIDMVGEIPADEYVPEGDEDAENIRRCLAMLTKIYREVMVRYYMKGQSVKQIAAELSIPENTVKTRLNMGRRRVRKEFEMENYTKQSYEPENLWLSHSGNTGNDNEPFSLANDKIAMNLLILAYEMPVTLTELANAIGISTVYIEPIIDRLVNGELMKKTADKVYTDFIIFTEKERTVLLDEQLRAADRFYKERWEIVEKGLEELREQNFYQAQKQSAQKKLESYFAVKTMLFAVILLRDEITGGCEPFANYPDRPNGGKWYALGNRYPADYRYSENPIGKYGISGENNNILHNYCGLKKIVMREFDCELGKTQQGYGSRDYMEYPMSGQDVLKMLYAVYTENFDDLPIINNYCFDNLDSLIQLGYLSRNESGKIEAEIPVLTTAEDMELAGLEKKYRKSIAENSRDLILPLMKQPAVVPKHLKSVPEWLKYLFCASAFPMRVLLTAYEEENFLAGCKRPVPAVVLCIEK